MFVAFVFLFYTEAVFFRHAVFSPFLTFYNFGVVSYFIRRLDIFECFFCSFLLLTPLFVLLPNELSLPA